MTTPANHLAPPIAPANDRAVSANRAIDERVIWHPPALMRRYQIAKAVGAAFFIVIFVGWLVIQWSNPVMRVVAVALLVMTVWYTLKSILGDWARMQGREIAIEHDTIHITEHGNVTRATLSEVATIQWRDETEAEFGLWLSATDGRSLARLGPAFVANPEEARAFLGWLRSHTNATFETRWPDAL